jgi:hypothetical protein
VQQYLGTSNPFLALLDPVAVRQVCDASRSLSGLSKRVHRPLSKPLLAIFDKTTADTDVSAHAESAPAPRRLQATT